MMKKKIKELFNGIFRQTLNLPLPNKRGKAMALCSNAIKQNTARILRVFMVESDSKDLRALRKCLVMLYEETGTIM